MAGHRKRYGEHAVVLGASLAGLVAAASLAPRFGRVTVVERDHLAADASPRRGVPQGRHGHVLLPSGLIGLEELLPGIVDELWRRGATRIPADAKQFRLSVGGGRLCVDAGDLTLCGATRPFLEAIIRDHVAALPGVDVVDGTEARALEATRDAARVTGVRVQPPDTSAVASVLAADLVVDATGRGSPSPRWLADLGYAAPAEERLPVGVHYTTRLFQRHEADAGGCRHAAVGIPPDGRRGGFTVAVEHDRWLVTLVGMLGERPAADLDGFVAYARSLCTGDVHEVVQRAEPIGEAVTGGFPAYRRYRYDRLRRFPDGLVVMGDALCSYNPAYAQGMAVAIAEAVELGRVLDEHGLDATGRRLFRRTRRLVEQAWTFATGADLAHPEVEGRRTIGWRVINSYVNRLLPLAHHDPVVARCFLEVNALLAPPSRLMAPRIAVRVLRGAPTRTSGPTVVPTGTATTKR